jgi:hypothetical protein
VNPKADEIFIQNITLSMKLNQLSGCVEASAREQQCSKLDAIYPRDGKSCKKEVFGVWGMGLKLRFFLLFNIAQHLKLEDAV